MNVSTQVVATEFDNTTINFSTNIITTDISNADLELRATGDVLFNDSVDITNDFTSESTSNLQNTNITGNITHTGTRNQTGNISATGAYTISQDLDVTQSTQIEDILFDDNFITTTRSNSDLDLRASGTGNVLVPSASVQIDNNLTAGTLNSNIININNEFELENMISSTDIEIFDNVITTTNSNSDLELRAQGSGSIHLESVEFTGNTIGSEATPDSTVQDLVFDTDQELLISTNNAFLLAKGTTAQRKNVQGDIRFNTTDNVFEGYNSSTITFNTGVYSDDRLTSVTADPVSDNLRFIIGGDDNPVDSTKLVGEISGDTLSIHGIQVDDINADGNTISTNVTNSNLELNANGTGKVIIDDLEFSGNTITNTSANSALKLASTGIGYPKFNGTGAIKVPSGTTAERPVSPVLGQTRHNTDLDILETWTGTQWQNSAGEFDAVSEAEMDDISLIQTLIYG
jgi:hypothetical protein